MFIGGEFSDRTLELSLWICQRVLQLQLLPSRTMSQMI